MLLAGNACSTVDTLSYAFYAEEHGIELTELGPPPGAIPLGTIFASREGFYLLGRIPIVPAHAARREPDDGGGPEDGRGRRRRA